MKRRTTTKQLQNAITKGLLEVRKAECSYKSSSQIDEMSRETFLDNLASINESGVFAGFVDWHYESNLSKRGYVLDSGAMNPYSETIVTAYLRVNDGVDAGDVEKALLFEEE